MNGPVDCLLEIAVVEDDTGALSTEFECDVLQVGVSSRVQDFPAHTRTSRKCNLYHASRPNKTSQRFPFPLKIVT